MNFRSLKARITLSPAGEIRPHVTVEAILDTGCQAHLLLPLEIVSRLNIRFGRDPSVIYTMAGDTPILRKGLVDVRVGGQIERNVEALCFTDEGVRCVVAGLPLLSKLSGSKPIQEKIREAFQIVDSSRITFRRRLLDDFEKLIGKKGVPEKTISQFLQKNFWIFGAEYLSVSAENNLGLSSRTDFLVKRHDGFHDIIEIKLPGVKLITKKGKREVWTSGVGNAVNQMMHYLTKYSILYLSQKEQTGLDVFMPKGIIVAGRSTERIDYLLRIFNSYLHRIEIVTYDTLVRRSRANLDGLETL